MNEEQKVLLSKVQHEFLSEVMQLLNPYTTVLTHFSPNDPNSVQQIGSGTFIRAKERYGILTAYHVLHSVRPKVTFGLGVNEVLGVAASDKDLLWLPCQYLNEISIAKPSSEEFGPDLTFIEIPISNELATLKAKKSFWNIDREAEVCETLVSPGVGLLCTMGSPVEKNEKETKGMSIHFKMASGGYFGGFTADDVRRDGVFDYIDTEIDYNVGVNMPEKFGGVSGGGLWSISMSAGPNFTNPKVENILYCGVAFYQTATEGRKCSIRHHFIRSIYGQARKALCEA
jgi:hypothetical protein